MLPLTCSPSVAASSRLPASRLKHWISPLDVSLPHESDMRSPAAHVSRYTSTRTAVLWSRSRLTSRDVLLELRFPGPQTSAAAAFLSVCAKGGRFERKKRARMREERETGSSERWRGITRGNKDSFLAISFCHPLVHHGNTIS